MRQKDPVLNFLLLFVSRQTIENGSLIPLKNINDEAKSKTKKKFFIGSDFGSAQSP